MCERQTQPGFTHGGAFAERLVIDQADVNLVQLPADVYFVAAASLGCRFATAFRAVCQQGRPAPGDWVAIHGCGGVGLSAIMVAVAAGARVIALDVSAPALRLAAELGASAVVNAADFDGDPVRIGDALRDMTAGGVSLSLDAYGSLITSAASVYSLRRRGRHVQLGVLPPELGVPPLPMHRVMGWELEIVGSHGMAAHSYPEMLAAVQTGSLQPGRLVTKRVTLADVCTLLPAFSGPTEPGITVVEMGDDHATPRERASEASATAARD